MLMFRMSRYLFVAQILVVLVLPALIFAQGIPNRIVPCDGIDCNVCHLAELAQNLINIGVYLFTFFAAAMFAYAGFLYLSNEALGKKQEGRKILENVAMGLVVLLSAWLVVDTLMKALLGGDFGPWNNMCRLLS